MANLFEEFILGGTKSNKASFVNLLKHYRINPTKKHGQNFIWNFDLLKNFLHKSNLTELKNVLEIGSGVGSLTYVLSQNAEKVVSLEIDESLREILGDLEASQDNIDIVFTDANKANWKEFFTDEELENVTLVSNLPYNLTTALINKAISEFHMAKQMLFLVEREAVPRILGIEGDGKSSSQNQGPLSKLVSAYGSARSILTVNATAFHPKPRVNSELILLTPNTDTESYKCLIEHGGLLERVIKMAYTQRRKTLANSFKGFDLKSDIQSWLEENNLPTSTRAEELSADEFTSLSLFLKDELMN